MSKVCVVIAVYNGEKYIIEQLDSIRVQTRQPDTVIIIDDCSKDNSVTLVSSYLEKYQLKWNLKIHEKNKGYIETFFEGINSCADEYIFPCDQDDIWNQNKIEVMLAEMESHPDCLVLCSDYKLLYEEGSATARLVPYYLYKKYGKIRKMRPWIKYTQRIIRPGCTFCVRREIMQYRTKYSLDQEAHDAFFYFISAVKDSLYVYPEKLILWRRHASNASNRPVPFENCKIALRNLTFFKNECPTNSRSQRQLEKMLRLNELRADYFEKHTFFRWVKMIPYFRYFENLFGIFWDCQWLFAKARRRNDQ